MIAKLLSELSPLWLRRRPRGRWARTGSTHMPAPDEADALWRDQDEQGLYGSDTQDYAVDANGDSAAEKPAGSHRGPAH